MKDRFEIDEYDEKKLSNQAHQIIYKSISGKLNSLHQRRKPLHDAFKRLYLVEYEKHKA